ncbi:MAG: hypothetical protein H7326_04805 [Bdellovibrionaceae bacterium]|nr:hypothetical protein [Pseudobdellovibrionaceae bacterium]
MMDISVYSQRDKVYVASIPGKVYTPKDKTRRALQRFFGFVALAAVSILAPVAHFFLVPAFLIAAPFVAYKAFREDVVLEGTELTCPECNKTSKFTKMSGTWPLHQHCTECMNRIYFEPAKS